MGFPLQSSQASPVTGAVTISALAVLPELGLTGVQFKINGHVLNALDTTSPFQVVWSAASVTDGDYVITAEARYALGVVIESAPLTLTVVNPATFNRTLYVDAAAGNDGNSGLTPSAAWRTLGKANAAVAAGDTVLLRGTFTGQLISPNASGTAAAPIRFASDAGEPAVLSGGQAAVSLNARSYIVMEGLRIQNVAGYAVQFNPGSHHNVLRDSVVTDTDTSDWGHAVRIEGSSDNLIEGNEITNVGNEALNAGDSIYLLSGSHRNRFLYNTVRNGGHSLFQMSSQFSTAASLDNVIAHNVLSNPWTTPIILTGSAVGVERTLIEYNKISDGAMNGVNFPRPGLQINAEKNIIRYNEIFNNAAAGIMLGAYTNEGLSMDANGNQIYHNVIYGNNQRGTAEHPGAIEAFEKDGRSVRDNLITNNILFRNKGLAFGGQNYTITVNFYNTPTAWPVGSLNGNRFENNDLLRQPGAAGEAVVLLIRNAGQGGNLSYTVAQFQATYSGARGNIEADPLFTNEATRVFTLRTGSPAIDAGLLIADVPYLGAAPDLGAFEYEAGGPADTTSPTIAVTSPTGGQTVAGTVTITASASDNVGVTRIDYLLDGTLLAVTSPPSSTLAWTTTTTSNGAHSLSARAYDAAGNVRTSAPVTVTVANPNPVPAITSLSPTSRTAGTTAFTLTVNGSNFVSGSQMRWNGSARTTTFVSGTQLTAAITVADIAAAGTAQVTVFTPTPGGGTSSALTFTINHPAPTASTLSPSSATAGGAAFTLTVTGSNFGAASKVRWNGADRTTTFASATQLTAAITVADIAAVGTAQVTVVTPAPGGGTSSALTFTTAASNPVPTLSGLTPSSATAGGATFTLTVTGSNFVAASKVGWNGADRTTTFASATQLTAAIPAADIATAGTAPVTVFTPTPGGGTSSARTFTIGNPVPTAATLSPSAVIAGGGAFALTVTGSNFVSGSEVRWNGSARATTAVDSTRLGAVILASDVAAAGTAQITVVTPAPGGGTSNAVGLSIAPAVDVTSGILNHWALDQGTGTTAPSASGLLTAGTLMNGPTWTVGKFAGALAFDGVDDFVQVPHVAALNPYPLTLSVWMKASPAAGPRGLVSKAVGSSGYRVYVDAGDLCAWYRVDSANHTHDGTACPLRTQGFSDNQWHHVTLVVDASGAALYMDGSRKAQRAWTGTAGAPTTTEPLLIGMAGLGFLGVLDDVRVYNRGFSGTEVSALYTGAVPSNDTAAPTVVGMTVSGITQTSVIVTWTTTELSDSQVAYGPTGAFGSATALKPALVVAHTHTITGLTPGTRYHFLAKSRDAAGNLAVSTNHAITTLGPDEVKKKKKSALDALFGWFSGLF